MNIPGFKGKIIRTRNITIGGITCQAHDAELGGTLIFVTREMAKAFLAPYEAGKVQHHREISEAVVEAYSRDMDNDVWTADSNAIVFSSGKPSVMENGYHRCRGLLKSKRGGFWAYVVGGATLDAVENIDGGYTRAANVRMNISKAEFTPLNYCTRLVVARSKITIHDIETVAEALLPYIRKVLGSCKKRNHLASAPIKLAAALKAADGSEDYALKLYRDFVMDNYGELPPIAKHFIMRVSPAAHVTTRGSSRALRLREDEKLAGALKMFSPDKADNNRIMIDDDARQQARDYVRYVVNKLSLKLEAQRTLNAQQQ
jgi:hypothetical protein